MYKSMCFPPEYDNLDWHERKQTRSYIFKYYVFGWIQEPCGACNGSGIYDNFGTPPCGACNGTGKQWCRGPKAKNPIIGVCGTPIETQKFYKKLI